MPSLRLSMDSKKHWSSTVPSSKEGIYGSAWQSLVSHLEHRNVSSFTLFLTNFFQRKIVRMLVISETGPGRGHSPRLLDNDEYQTATLVMIAIPNGLDMAADVRLTTILMYL